eukprot:XP_011603476.1 PREDICTED: centrosomal protein of 162 kDa isoform X1 [Takifugu rubripes]
MPGGLTEEELEQQFELFLNEPVSDESVDWSSTDQRSRTQGSRRTAQNPAWCKEDECREPRPKLVTLETSVLLDKSHKDPFLNDAGGPWSSGRFAREKLRQMSDERRCDGSPTAGTSTQSDGGSRGAAADGSNVGFDTLEEEEEKKRFFANLQAGVSSPLDYSELIGELDSMGSTTGKDLGKLVEAAELRGHDEGMEEILRERAALTGSPQYSDDFEEGDSGREQQVSKEPEILAQDLPTAEELMKAICPEKGDTRNSFLPPKPWADENPHMDSGAQLEEKKRSQILEGTFLLETGSGLQPKLLGQSRPLTCLKDSRSSEEPPVHQQTWSIRQEVDRLMQDHNTGSSQPSSLDPKADKNPCHSKNPSVASLGGRVSTIVALNTAAVGQRVLTLLPQQHRGDKTASKHKEEDEGPGDSSVVVLQQQREASSHPRASDTQQDTPTPQLPNNCEENNSSQGGEELRLQRAPKKDDLHSLKQHTYLLQSKVWSAEEATEQVGSVAGERFQQMQKEIKEQETLLRGYQQENEKLYLQLKAEKSRSKASKDTMFQENQSLLSQLAFLREQLRASRSSSVDHAEHTPELQAEISRLQRNETQLREDMDRLKQANQALLADLQLMKKERELAKPLIAPATAYRAERSAPKQQKMAAADAARLKAASADIQRLKDQVEKMKTDMAKRSTDHQRRAREKRVDQKRIEELERQVRELERLQKNGKPYSPPAPIPTAVTADGQGDADAANNSTSSRINVLLELKIQRLEAELENHNQEAKRSYQAMEEQFHKVKVHYEQHICALQQRLEAANVATEPDGHRAQVQSLEEELQRVRRGHQEREKSLQDVVAALQQQLKHKARSSPARREPHAEAAFRVRIERLNQELSAKTRTIQELSRSVDRLEKEKRNALTVSSSQTGTEKQRAETGEQPGAAKKHPCGRPAAGETFPVAGYQKPYKPTVFADSHISDVMQENEALRERLQLLELRSEQEKEALKEEVAQAREELLRMQESCSEQRRAAQALQHSSAQVAVLTNRLHTQQITVNILQQQLGELQGAKDGLEMSRRREDALQQQLGRLLRELKEAKDCQSPEVKLLCSLEKKLVDMELRHQSRQNRHLQVIDRSWPTFESDKQSQVECWRRVAEDQRRQLDAFRQELDSILDILRYLQREGVVLSFPAPSTPPPPHTTE